MSKKQRASKYGLKEFKDLSTSTSTIMIYTNVFYDTAKLFETLELTKINTPLTKKQKNVDKDKLEAPYGAIISVQSKTKIRGVNLKKKKKHWCTICQPIETRNDKVYKVLTITEHFEEVLDKKGRCLNIIYYCSKCQKHYKPEEQKKISHFLNQITIVMSLGKKDRPLLNIMLFKSSFKIAGCKNREDAIEAIMVLWQDYIVNKPKTWKLATGVTNPRFVFETVMRNVGFKLGFAIERPALNTLMNEEKYQDHVFMSQYEPSAHTNVNIKMFSEKPKNFRYDCLVIPLDTKRKPFFIYLTNIPYKVEKKKQKIQGKYTTFIVFSSSETILSGRYDQNMEEMYNFFVTAAFKNKKAIEENLQAPNQDAIEKIKSRLK